MSEVRADSFEARREDMAKDMKKGEEMLLEEEKLIEKIKKGVIIEMRRNNHFVEGSDPYNEVEEFFSEELPKYDTYVRENIVDILREASHDGKNSDRRNSDGFVKLPGNIGKSSGVSGGWIDPMNQENGFGITLNGGDSSLDNIAEWTVDFTPELYKEIQEHGAQFVVFGGSLEK